MLMHDKTYKDDIICCTQRCLCLTVGTLYARHPVTSLRSVATSPCATNTCDTLLIL